MAADRYRPAVARARTTGCGGPRGQVVVPLPLADAMRALLTGQGSARVAVDGDRVTLETDGGQAAGPVLGHGFPDHHRPRPPAGRSPGPVGTAAFRQALETGPVPLGGTRDKGGEHHGLSALRVTDDGSVFVCGDTDDATDDVAVNRAFLLDALAAGARERLVLELGAPPPLWRCAAPTEPPPPS